MNFVSSFPPSKRILLHFVILCKGVYYILLYFFILLSCHPFFATAFFTCHPSRGAWGILPHEVPWRATFSRCRERWPSPPRQGIPNNQYHLPSSLFCVSKNQGISNNQCLILHERIDSPDGGKGSLDAPSLSGRREGWQVKMLTETRGDEREGRQKWGWWALLMKKCKKWRKLTIF